MSRSSWFRHGFWNTLEHAVTRVADASASLVLLWALRPEIFAKLASSQALIAPVLLLWICPETVLYRDYAAWKAQGVSSVAAKLSAFRRFAWGKAQFAVVLAAVLSFFAHDNPWDRFWALVWAFALVMGPQLSGPDREYLRLDLRLRRLNLLSLFQKVSLLGGTVIAAFACPDRLDALALVAVTSTVSTAFLASREVRSLLRAEGASEAALLGQGNSVTAILREAMTGFSIWQHGNGVLLGWIQTMDLFFLTVLALPGRPVGLYAAVLKVANFSTFLPVALGNFFLIWLGRGERPNELRQLVGLSALLAVGIALQCGVLYWLAPWIFSLFSHGRWSADEITAMRSWFGWILAGAGTFSTTFLLSSWLMVRTEIAQLFKRVYVPWTIASIGIYYGGIHYGMTRGGGFRGAAIANIFVSLAYLLLLAFYASRKNFRTVRA